MVATIVSGMISVGLVSAGGSATAADTGNASPQSGRIVSADPASFTPNVMDGTVHSMAKVGNMVVVGGDFTRVRNAGSNVDIPRSNLFAFNAATGQVSTTFVPNPNNTVYKVLPAADGTSVYAGGHFTSVTSNGVATAVGRLYRVDVATGNRIASFNPGTLNGQVRDISLTGNHLWISGKFTHVQGQARTALATINPTTGARDPFYDHVVSGQHRDGVGVTNVLKIATDPSNTRLVAIGNFAQVDGVNRHQIAVFDITGATATLADYYTPLYETPCSRSFETYMTDVAFSPNGNFFVVSTTGAFGGAAASGSATTGCDVVARFETNASGTSVQPTWTNYTGGDTTWSVEVTDDVVYTGGHMRWQNNPTRGDAPGQGAISRPGIAALNTVNGMPYSWNPTRDLGVGVRDMLATDAGLFVGSDTDVIGGETHRKMAFFPLDATLPARQSLSIPGTIFRVASGQSQLLRRDFDGTQVTASDTAPNGSGWGSTTGAFMINGDLYTAYSNGSFTRRAFDGTTYGSESVVNTADQLVNQSDWHGTDLPNVTSLFYDAGWLYFTRSGSSTLFRRAFEPESGIVGQQRFSMPSVTGVSYASMRGAFVANGRLWFASTDGSLRVADWDGSGAVDGTATTLSAAGSGWASRVMFGYQGTPIPPPHNDPPVPAFAVDCTGLTCTFDGSGSADPDGTLADFAWDFGDGQQVNGASATANHTYAVGGARTVTLTVTDDGGATGVTTRTANPSTGAAQLTHVASDSTNGNRLGHSVAIPSSVQPGDLLLLFMVANDTSATYTGPNGWAQIQAVSGDGTVGRAYSRVAVAGDAGSTVAVTSDVYAKDVTSVAAYRGAGGAAVANSAVALQTSSTAAHTTPTLNATTGTGWLVSYWADKGASTTTWSLPGGAVLRSTSGGTGGGHISAVLADSDSPVPAGQQGGVTATADFSGSAAITFSVLVEP